MMIFAVKPFEIHDGDGIRTTVFFKGCPLRCRWCHNPESFSRHIDMMYDAALCVNCGKCASLCDANRMERGVHLFDRTACTACGACRDACLSEALTVVGEERDVETLTEELLRDAVFMRGSGGGVTFSGGEPLMQIDACVALAKRLRTENINIAVDTSVYVSRETLDRIIPYVDTFLFDVKAINEDVHKRCTGVSNRKILDNIRYVDSLGIPMEIRYPYVPTYNDGEAMDVARFVSTLKNARGLRVLPYHNYADRKYACLGLRYETADISMPSREELDLLLSQMGETVRILNDK